MPRGERGRAYGLYDLVWGLAWWAGSLLLGVLYDRDRTLAGVVASAAMIAGSLVVALSSRRPRPKSP